jgi:hypothetical protein
MNLLFLRDWVREKAINANIGYADIETLYDVNELLNKRMPCLMFNYEQESNQYRESPFTEVNLKIYLIKNFFEAEKIETELYERDYITPAKNELNELYKDFLRYLQREEAPIIEVLRDTKLQLAERVSIEGFLIMEATITINVERQFCLDESGGNFCAPVTYLVEYENGTEIKSGSEPSGGNIFVQVPNPTAQCNPIPYLIERDGIEFQSGNLNQGDSLFVNVPSLCAPCADATAQINGVNVLNIASGGSENINVEYQNGTPVGSLVSGVWTIPNPITCDLENSATPLNTGSTSEINQARKRTNGWLTLRKNNPFGNLNRFTDSVGGQTYANEVVYDWANADYDTRNVMVWFLTPISGTLTDMLASEPYTRASVSGWRVPDMQEVFNILHFGVLNNNDLINYTPFNYQITSAQQRIRTRTDALGDSTQSYVVTPVATVISAIKTQSNNTLLVNYLSF